ncbi:MAG: YwaF family protein [Erysipelotrichaceae bacterium]|nr:YwaF family protein [Erysipelotrichaceae bacterium]
MTWGFLSSAHIISLILAVGIITLLYFILKNKSDRVKTIVLGILSFSGIAAIIYNLVAWNSPLEYLPLHLCSLNAMVLPFAVFTRKKVLNNLLLLWSIGALFALIINVSVSEAEILSWTFVFYYFPHVFELGIPILMFLLKLAKKDVKCIISTVVITMTVYTLIHFVNLWINSYAIKNNIVDLAGNVIKVNYMYSIYPDNPLLNLLYSIIPYQYWYMYLTMVVIVIYLGIVYLKDILKLIKAKKQEAING